MKNVGKGLSDGAAAVSVRTAKAGGHHYVNSLRRWATLTNTASSSSWHKSGGALPAPSQSIELDSASKRIFQRYRRHANPGVRSG